MKHLTILFLYISPVITFAEGTDKNFSTLVYGAGDFFGRVFMLIVALSVLAFLFGLTRVLLGVGSSEKQSQAKAIMVWGIIGLFVVLSIMGILNLGLNTFKGFV